MPNYLESYYNVLVNLPNKEYYMYIKVKFVILC